jgi:hypothetical protein
MAKRKQGWELGQGKFSQPVKLNEGPKLEDTQKGKEITEVYTDNDLGAIRGTRDGFA